MNAADDMPGPRVAIVGGGLSGLYAASLLEARGVRDYVLLEARSRTGGRLESVAVDGDGSVEDGDSGNRFDLGAAWLWPAVQPELAQLVAALGLEQVPQHEQGEVVYEASAHTPPTRVHGLASPYPAVRLAGGMRALVDALHAPLDARRIRLGQPVVGLRQNGMQVTVVTKDAEGTEKTCTVEHVFLAVPPRLAATRIAFAPALPVSLAMEWLHTPTWMAPHAKYVAVYERPFWRDQGLSGGARSMAGPLAEIHDISSPGGDAALFGFLGWPLAARQRHADEALRALCRAQLGRLFGEDATRPKADFLRDWAMEPFTATVEDREAGSAHGLAPQPVPVTGPWKERLTGIASEWSLFFGGYVAGAIEAARRGVDAWLHSTPAAAGMSRTTR